MMLFSKKYLYVLMLLFSNASFAEGFGLTLDQNYYFQKKGDKEIIVTVTNETSKLLFADVNMYEGILDKNTDSVNFDYDNKMLNYDIFPKQTAIPAGQKRTIKLIRADDGSKYTGEEYFRIRVIPKSPDEAVKANPALLKLLSPSDLRELEDTDKVKGALRVYVGSGSVLIVQNDLNVKSDALKASLKKDNDGVVISVMNNSEKTISLNKIKVHNGSGYVFLGDFALRGGKTKNFKIFNHELIENKVAESDLKYMTYISQANIESKVNL